MSVASVRIVVELEPGTGPICGVVRREPGAERRFAGWLELCSALERLRGDAPACAPAAPAADGPP